MEVNKEEIKRRFRLVADSKYRRDNPSGGDGDIFTLEEFYELVQIGMFTNNDGEGYYGYELMYLRDAPAIPSKILRDGLDAVYTHVIWFNK